MKQITYGGAAVDFKEIAYQYMKVREGYRNEVYKDVKGLDTVGIGHLVTGSEPFAITAGVALSDAQVQQLFDMDYARLHIEGYATEIQDAGYSYNMMLAVAHFIWMHGYGQYDTSHLRSGLLANSFDADSVQVYLRDNWDKSSLPVQKQNNIDFNMGFSDTPWTPGFHLQSRSI